MFADLAIAHGDAGYARCSLIARAKLLILDDWGSEALTPEQARDLLEIVEDRYDKGSLIITSQVPVDRWHDMIGIPTLADAILDRIIRQRLSDQSDWESMRKSACRGYPRRQGSFRQILYRRAFQAPAAGGRGLTIAPPGMNAPPWDARIGVADLGRKHHPSRLWAGHHRRQIQTPLTNQNERNIIDPDLRRQTKVSGFKSERCPASDRKRCPA